MKQIPIIYENEEILIINKPAGIAVQGGKDIAHPLDKELPMQLGYPIYLVHRLDRPTGGVMVFARTPKAAAALSAMVQDHEIFVKEYLAVLPARPTFPEGELCDRLYHDRRANRAFVVDGNRKGTKENETLWNQFSFQYETNA